MHDESATEPRVAVVTGAARGIGAAIARRLASDGAAVALLDLDAEGCEKVAAQIRGDGGRAWAGGVDVTDSARVEAAVEAVATELGPPVILVNNAGITRDNMLFKMTEGDWDAVMNVHLKGAFLMSRTVQRHMTAQRYGRIVNISSISALGNRGQANYASAKAGIQAFTKTLALELGKFGVTVNSVAPGFVVTEMTSATAERLGLAFEDYQNQAAEQVAVRRVGRPEDIAHAVAFLTAEASSYVSGQVLYVAGGPVN